MTNSNSNSTSLGGALSQLENLCDEYLVKKAPFALPTKAKEVIVNFGPWITLILLVLALPALLAAFGMTAALTPFAYASGIHYGFGYTASMIFTAVALVLEALALPGLFKKTKGGWNFLFYAILVSAISSLVSLNIVGMIVSTLIGLYVLFQIKEYYK
jgi:hypothetical protein